MDSGNAVLDVDLFTMSNLSPKRTGLSFVVWISPKGGAQHDVRVKVTRGPKAIPGEFVTVTVRLRVESRGDRWLPARPRLGVAAALDRTEPGHLGAVLAWRDRIHRSRARAIEAFGVGPAAKGIAVKRLRPCPTRKNSRKSGLDTGRRELAYRRLASNRRPEISSMTGCGIPHHTPRRPGRRSPASRRWRRRVPRDMRRPRP
jgi:hypothetical protein